jgi:Amt family ammonium transporter
MRIPTRRLLWLAFLFVLFPLPALADNGNNDPFLALNTLWVLMAAFLVFFMQAGFGMVEVGLIRAKNACNILMKNLLDYCMASLAYFIFGYAIMFGGSGALFGTKGWFLIEAESSAGLPLMRFGCFRPLSVVPRPPSSPAAWRNA